MCCERAPQRVGHATRTRLSARARRGTGSPRRRGGGRRARRAEHLARRPRPRRLEQPSGRNRLDERPCAGTRGEAAPRCSRTRAHARLGAPVGRERGSYRRRVSSRGRIFAIVALSAVVASGVVVVGVLATRNDVPPTPKVRSGRPPLSLDLALRTDPEARALRQALAERPVDAASRLQQLEAEHQRSSLVALHLGLTLYWLRRNDEALTAWRTAAQLQPDTPYAVRAEDFLHPRFAPGLPRFVPSFPSPPRIRALPPAQQLAALRRAAAAGGAREKLLYGVALQQLDRPLSAERQFAAAARVAPGDPDARVA